MFLPVPCFPAKHGSQGERENSNGCPLSTVGFSLIVGYLLHKLMTEMNNIRSKIIMVGVGDNA